MKPGLRACLPRWRGRRGRWRWASALADASRTTLANRFVHAEGSPVGRGGSRSPLDSERRRNSSHASRAFTSASDSEGGADRSSSTRRSFTRCRRLPMSTSRGPHVTDTPYARRVSAKSVATVTSGKAASRRTSPRPKRATEVYPSRDGDRKTSTASASRLTSQYSGTPHAA